MPEPSDAQLLRDYADSGNEPAFRDLVTRHTDFIYSSALRQVGSSDAACDVVQRVFADLARKARSIAEKLSPGASLAGWLHRSTRYAALNHLRDARRRRVNERQAMEQLLADSASSPDWERICSALDEALDSLHDDDREVLLLRYFESRDLRSVGLALGVSDDAAQKRVSRAVERLREFFARRDITVSASGLVVCLAANAVQAAPAGLATAISAATLAGTAAAATTAAAAAATQAIVMTTLQKTLVTAVITILAGVGVYEARQVASLQKDMESLRQERAALVQQVGQLQGERDAGAQRLAAAVSELAAVKQQPTEVHKLRGEVGVLRQEKDEMAGRSALSKITADPETRRLMREQQKAGMSAVYRDLVVQLKLTPEVAAQFNDLMADHVMENIEAITQALHDKRSTAEINALFNAQEKAQQGQLRALIGEEALVRYTDYSNGLFSTVSAAQFESSLTGGSDVTPGKRRQFLEALQEESRHVVARYGLDPDFQTIPMLNFRNIASEEQGEFSLRLMDDIYAGVAARAAAFLTEDELAKLQEFRTKAQDNNRTALMINRKLMAPVGK